MAVTSVQDIERFTPARYLVDSAVPPGVPVYLIAPLSWKERARFRASLAREGVRFPQDAEIVKAVRTAIAEAAPANIDQLLTVVQEFDDMLASEPPSTPTEGASEDAVATHKEEIARRVSIAQAYEGIVDLLRQHPAVGNLLSLRTLFYEIAPPLAASYGLRGWENIATPFERVGGVVPDRLLDILPLDDLIAVGNQALVLQSVSAAQKGN